MVDAILVNPKGFDLINDQTLPFGLLYTASYAVKDFDIKIIDKRVDNDWEKKLVSCLKENPLAVGITCMTGPMILDALSISKIVHENSSAKVVWGGIHPSLEPLKTLKNELIDMVIVGEGEITFHELLKSLKKGLLLDNVDGLVYKDKDGLIKENKPRKLIMNLDEIPRLPYNLINMEKYVQNKEGRGGKRSITFFTSRGCPHKCIYCYNAKFNKSFWRQMSSQKVLDEIKYVIDTYNLKNLFFLDDNFFVNTKRVEEIANGIHEQYGGTGFTWDVLGAQISTLKNMDIDLLRRLYDYGCRSMLIGVEAGNQRMMDLIKKGITIEQILKVNKNLYDSKIKAYYSFMSGFPTETDQDRMDSIKLMLRLKGDNPDCNVGTMKPAIVYPGTDIYEFALQHGFKPPEKLEDWAGVTWGNYTNINLPWIDKNTRKKLVHIYYYTLLSDPDHLYINSRLFKLGAYLMKDIAKYRLRNQNFMFPIESKAIHFVQEHFM